MKNLKQINLLDSYMDPADFRFFCSQWAPNGTSDLIIVDQDGQIVESISEALFSPPQDNDRHGAVFGQIFYCDSDSVFPVEPDSEEQESDIFPLTLDDVLSSIAQSPVQSRISVLRQIVSALKRA
jgi:hypothetical protein